MIWGWGYGGCALAPTTLATNTSTHIVVSDGAQLLRVGKNGEGVEPIVACSKCILIGTDTTYVYWYDVDAQLRVHRTPHQGPGAGTADELLSFTDGLYSVKGGHIVRAGFVATRDALWFSTLEGPEPLQWKPWLARLSLR